MTTHCILTDKVKALEDQMLACVSCWNALFAAAVRGENAASVFELRHHFQLIPAQHDDSICS